MANLYKGSSVVMHEKKPSSFKGTYDNSFNYQRHNIYSSKLHKHYKFNNLKCFTRNEYINS